MEQPNGPHSLNLVFPAGMSRVRQITGLPGRIFAIRKLGRTLSDAADTSLSASHPVGLTVNPRGEELRDAAMALVLEGRLTDAAAESLRAQATEKAKDLMWAAASARSQGWVEENPFVYWTNELLQAAAEQRPVQPPTPEQQPLFDKVAVLNDCDPEQAYARLAEACPALKGAETDLLARWADRTEATTDKARVGGYLAKIKEVAAVLRPVVGPRADTTDSFLRTKTAYARAEYHFEQLARQED